MSHGQAGPGGPRRQAPRARHGQLRSSSVLPEGYVLTTHIIPHVCVFPVAILEVSSVSGGPWGEVGAAWVVPSGRPGRWASRPPRCTAKPGKPWGPSQPQGPATVCIPCLPVSVPGFSRLLSGPTSPRAPPGKARRAPGLPGNSDVTPPPPTIGCRASGGGEEAAGPRTGAAARARVSPLRPGLDAVPPPGSTQLPRARWSPPHVPSRRWADALRNVWNRALVSAVASLPGHRGLSQRKAPAAGQSAFLGRWHTVCPSGVLTQRRVCGRLHLCGQRPGANSRLRVSTFAGGGGDRPALPAAGTPGAQPVPGSASAILHRWAEPAPRTLGRGGRVSLAPSLLQAQVS